MEILFTNEESKKQWENLKKDRIDDNFSLEIISFTENWIINMQNLLGDKEKEIIFEEDWDERELNVFNAHYSSISAFQNAVNAETLYESRFQKLINTSFELAGGSKFSNNEIKCAITFVCIFWKYGNQFKYEMHRKEKAEELKKRLKRLKR